ncbi:MAG: hypothetical protein QF440_02900 [Candidatus Thalassarchaeaceae archaeon]|jgi:hypothetical protein|nr:hypothetical protein [Candidatus Thalassarchaeaceae archaeon]
MVKATDLRMCAFYHNTMGHKWTIITDDDCLHCIELEALLGKEENIEWLPRIDASKILKENPILTASIDVLPYAILILEEKPIAVVRAATPERMAETLAMHQS